MRDPVQTRAPGGDPSARTPAKAAEAAPGRRAAGAPAGDPALRERLLRLDAGGPAAERLRARGFGAAGRFELTASLADLTCADLFQRVGEITEVVARFEGPRGERGAPDLSRGRRGFVTTFLGRRGGGGGAWELPGASLPPVGPRGAAARAEAPARDPAVFPAQAAHDAAWERASRTPEALHEAMWALSDRGLPRSVRFMEGFAAQVHRLTDAAGTVRFARFRWRPVLGLQSVLRDEAAKINAADPDYHRRDLWEAIAAGAFPQWDLCVQVYDAALAARLGFDPQDPAPQIPQEELPLRPVGRLTLDRQGPEVGTGPAAPRGGAALWGIERLDPPARAPSAPFGPGAAGLSGFADACAQARRFHRSQTGIEQERLVEALAVDLSRCAAPAVRARVVARLRTIDEALAGEVAEGLGMEVLPPPAGPARPPAGLRRSPGLSILADPPGTFRGRRLGLLIADGAEPALLAALTAAAQAAGATVERIALTLAGAELSDGARAPAGRRIDAAPSALYDAVAVLAGKAGARALARRHEARAFLADACLHGKFVALSPAARDLWFESVPQEPDEGVVTLDAPADAARFLGACAALRLWRRAG